MTFSDGPSMADYDALVARATDLEQALANSREAHEEAKALYWGLKRDFDMLHGSYTRAEQALAERTAQVEALRTTIRQIEQERDNPLNGWAECGRTTEELLRQCAAQLRRNREVLDRASDLFKQAEQARDAAVALARELQRQDRRIRAELVLTSDDDVPAEVNRLLLAHDASMAQVEALRAALEAAQRWMSIEVGPRELDAYDADVRIVQAVLASYPEPPAVEDREIWERCTQCGTPVYDESEAYVHDCAESPAATDAARAGD